eukprot:6187041-Pleurochrysis_carterae.AAC.2
MGDKGKRGRIQGARERNGQAVCNACRKLHEGGTALASALTIDNLRVLKNARFQRSLALHLGLRLNTAVIECIESASWL